MTKCMRQNRILLYRKRGLQRAVLQKRYFLNYTVNAVVPVHPSCFKHIDGLIHLMTRQIV